jgi:RHS repeat-associated protein
MERDWLGVQRRVWCSDQATPTDFACTGQYSNVAHFGLMYYNARWYDPTIARFAQADTIVPDIIQGLDRYAYGLNDPLRYSDPTGHYVCEEVDACTPSDLGSVVGKNKNPVMKISGAATDMMLNYESIVLHLYDDPAGNCTVGIGHLVHLGSCNGDISEMDFEDGISTSDAYELFQADVEAYELAVLHNTAVPLTQEQFDALVSFTYNVGIYAFATSDLIEGLNQSDYDSVPGQLDEWVYAPDPQTGDLVKLEGLVTRRQEEGILFSLGIYPAP